MDGDDDVNMIFCECQEEEFIICGWNLDTAACSTSGTPMQSELNFSN